MLNQFDSDLIKFYDSSIELHGFIKKYDSPIKFNVASLKDIFSSRDIDVQQFLNSPNRLKGCRIVIAHDTLTNDVYVMFWGIETTATDFFKSLTKNAPTGIPKVDWLKEFIKNTNYAPVRWVIWSGAMRDESKIMSVQMDTEKFIETNKMKETWCMFTKYPVSLYSNPEEWQPYPIGNM